MDKIWVDTQCENMCIKEEYKEACKTKNLEECKNSCASTDGCTAINYRAERSSCGLRKCPRPVEAPSDEKTAEDWNWRGFYYIDQGKLES